jgi:hypothetical protein
MTRATADGIARALTERQQGLERERQRTLSALMADLRFARETRAEWYRWVTDGMPRLSQQEYEQVGKRRARKPTSK